MSSALGTYLLIVEEMSAWDSPHVLLFLLFLCRDQWITMSQWLAAMQQASTNARQIFYSKPSNM